jgi:UDP-N-acetylglucosamine-lysosomal-enzyme
MIDRVAMAKLQAKYPREYAATGARRFRTTQDMQYAFAYFHFLVEGGGREGLDVGAYFSMELDSDGDGVLSDNELYTLGAVTYKRTPTPTELQDLRVCLVGGQGENVTHLTTTSKKHGKGMREVEVRRVVLIREVTWDTIMNCATVVDALSKNARFGPTAQDMGNAANEEVAFEMVGDDFNKTTEQLDAVRAKRPKFVCLNDNMKVAPPHVIAVLRNFLESYYGTPSPMELPPGSDNPYLYIEPLRKALLVERVWKGVLYVSLGVLAAGGLAVALAVWAERVEEKESKRGGARGSGAAAGKVGGRDTPASGKRAGSTPRAR